MADGILAAVNENGNIDRFIDTKGGVHYIEPKRYEESVAKIDAAATKAKETVNSATEAVSECKAQTGDCAQETARAKEIADTVESRITGIEGDIATLRDSVSQDTGWVALKNSPIWCVSYRKVSRTVYVLCSSSGAQEIGGSELVLGETLPVECRPKLPENVMAIRGILSGVGVDLAAAEFCVDSSGRMIIRSLTKTKYWNAFAVFPVNE